MIPKLKKKISSFIKDESGTISKKNLINGAIVIAGISSFAKSIKARTIKKIEKPNDYSTDVDGGDGFPGDKSGQKLQSIHFDANDFDCDVTHPDVTGGPGYAINSYCHSSGGDCDKKHYVHNNNVKQWHSNTNRDFHKNYASKFFYDSTEKKVVAQHSHHGQHVNGSIETARSDSGNHCSY